MNRAARLPQSRRENPVVREVDDEILVDDLDRKEAHCLNRTVALVWNQCDGKTTATEAARALTQLSRELRTIIRTADFQMTHAAFAIPKKDHERGGQENNKADHKQDHHRHHPQTDRIGRGIN